MLRLQAPCPAGDKTAIRSGVALILVVIVIALLTTAGLGFALLMQQSHVSSVQTSRKFQSESAADSAAVVAMHYASLTPSQRKSLGGHQANTSYFVESFVPQESELSSPLDSLSTESTWTDSADVEGPEPVVDSLVDTDSLPDDFDIAAAGFVIFDLPDPRQSDLTGSSSMLDSDQGIRFGMTDESTKLNLQRLLIWERQGADVSRILQLACGLSAAQADHLLDWGDADSQTRPNGGELSEYATLGLTYGPPNRLPQSYNELAMIPGLSLKKIFGKKWLLPEFQLPGNEDFASELALSDQTSTWTDAIENSESDFQSAQLSEVWENSQQLPLLQTLSLSSQHRLTDSNGKPLIDINQPELEPLQRVLTSNFDANLANYVVLCRQFGAQSGIVTEPAEGTRLGDLQSVTLDDTKGDVKLRSVLQLIDSHVIVPQSGDSLIFNSPLRKVEADPNFLQQIAKITSSCFFAPPHEFSQARIHHQSPLVQLIPGLSETAIQWLQQQQDESSDASPMVDSALLSGISAVTEDSIGDSWTTGLVQAYLDQQLTETDFQLLMDNLCSEGDTFSAWILAHSGYFQHPILARLVINGSEDRPRQLYYQRLFFPPLVAQSLQKQLTQPSSR